MQKPISGYYKLNMPDGLEALHATHYNLSFPAHFHQTYNISLVYEGSFFAELNGSVITAPRGSILITNPGEIHANPCDKKSSLSFFTFYIPADVLCYNSGKVWFEQKVIYDPVIFDQLHQLSLIIRKSNTDNFFLEKFYQTLQQLAVIHGSTDTSFQAAQLTLFNEFLSENHLSKFSLEDAAQRFGLDKFKFLRLFKLQTGLTPNNYFILKRIEQSKALLREGRDLLSIAIDLDFYDAAHFCKHFKKFTGITPMAYTSA